MTAEEKEEQSLWASPAWYSEGEYSEGDIVREGVQLFMCLKDHYASVEKRPGFSPLWKNVTPALRSRYATVTKKLPE